MVGKQLSHYRIVAELGRGGMGIVYKAEDTKLDRTVAIKVLPPAALSNEDDRTRFYREAKAAAQLQHPNIASIYEIDEAVPHEEGVDPTESAIQELHPFIAMEFIDGETLSERITTSPLKISEAVRIATGIADALKLAHSKDIVHRDIKSSNIMLDSEGRAKVLDFGLAKTAHSTMLTRMGSTIGTVAYMSPEQAKGEDVDSRTDLWALGVVMHELIVGRLPFGGDYEQAIVYSILNEQNEPLTAVRTGVPMELERIVNKMLSKQQDLRYQTAADLMADLKAVNLQASTTTMPAATTASMATHGSGLSQIPDHPAAIAQAKPTNTRLLILAGVAAIALGIVGYLFGSGGSGTASSSTVTRMDVVIPGVQNVRDVTASPDGSYWALRGIDENGDNGIFIYDTYNGTSHLIANSAGFRDPLFSPDGNWLLATGAFDNPGVYRIQVPRGQPVPTFRGADATWRDSRSLLLATRDSILTYDIATNTEHFVARVDTAAGYVGYFEPNPTTDPALFLVTAQLLDNDSADILLFDIESGEYTVVERAAYAGQYISSGHLAYGKLLNETDWQINFAAFNLHTGQFEGPSTALDDPWSTNVSFFAESDHTLFLQQEVAFISGSQVGWFDTETEVIEVVSIEAGDYDRISASPRSDAVAIESVGDNRFSDRNILTLDLATSSINRITYERPYNAAPVYGPVSGRLYYFGAEMQNDPNADIYVKNADGSGAEERVIEGGRYPTLTPDEKWVAYVSMAPGGNDILAQNLETGEIVPIDTSFGSQTDPQFSPDGSYIIYSSRPDSLISTEDQALYVRSFPDTDQYYRKLSEDVDIDDPIWSSDGQFIYFRNASGLSRIAVSLENGFSTRSRIEDVDIPAQFIRRQAADPTSGRLLLNYIAPGDQGTEDAPFDFHIIQNLPALLTEIAPKYE